MLFENMSDWLRTLEPWWVVAVTTITLLIQVYVNFWKDRISLQFSIQKMSSSGDLSKFHVEVRNVGKKAIDIITCELWGANGICIPYNQWEYIPERIENPLRNMFQPSKGNGPLRLLIHDRGVYHFTTRVSDLEVNNLVACIYDDIGSCHWSCSPFEKYQRIGKF